MGADIHLVLEKKFGDKWIGVQEAAHRLQWGQDKETKKWQQTPVWDRSRARNYDLFAKLAGVRGSGPAPKGLPDDVSELAQALSDEIDSDGHSHSYCSLDEYIRLLVETEHNPAEVLLVEHPAVTDPHGYYFERYAPEPNEEYRVVFWFDN